MMKFLLKPGVVVENESRRGSATIQVKRLDVDRVTTMTTRMIGTLLVLVCLVLGGLAEAATHSLDFDNDPRARQIVNGSKSQGGRTDRIFRDGLGREAVFRGYNVSGSSKHVETVLKPFKNPDDAERAFQGLRRETGANLVRFLIAWEGVNPAPDVIDVNYLQGVAAQLRMAFKYDFHVLLAFHQDLFSRHLFNADSWHTGDGAPAYVTPNYPREYCGIICVNWSQHNLTDEAVRLAFRNFWNNAPFMTVRGEKRMQDVFIWQMQATLRYLRDNLTDAEFDRILGVDPFNEPVDGGMEGLSPAQWDNQKLWPFYQRARAAADAAGWQNKWVFAEPLVFWNTTAGLLAPATGGHHLLQAPGTRYGFNSHFYDAGRMGVDFTGVDNGSYLPHFDQIRDEARFWGSPPLVSEFGMWLHDIGAKDTNRIIKASWQGLELSDAWHPKDRFADAYAPQLSATQWHWDIYWNRHREYQNGNPAKLITGKDAWNEENFSVIEERNGQILYNVDANNVRRAYPRRAQGDILQFHYNDLSRDEWGKLLDWAALRPLPGDKEYFRQQQFAWMAWRGRRSEAPTELFLPPQFDPARLVVLTEQRIVRTSGVAVAPQHTQNEVLLLRDQAGGGYRLLVWDDADSGENESSWHYALVVNAADGAMSDAQLAELQRRLNTTLLTRQLSPVYLTGKLTHSGYAEDTPAQTLKLEGYTYQFLWWKYATFWWTGGTGDVDIYMNGSRVDSGGASGTRAAWYYSGATRYQVCEKSGRRCSNAMTVE